MGEIALSFDCFRQYKQQVMDKREADLANNRFITGRGLDDYSKAFPDLKEELMKLSDEDEWWEVGAGQGKPFKDYIDRGGQAKLRAFGIKKPNKIAFEETDRATYHEIGIEDFQYNGSRPVKKITDVVGASAYTLDISGVLNFYLKNLAVDGKIHIVLSNTIIYKGNKKIGLGNWFKDGTGFTYAHIPANKDQDIAYDTISFTKTSEDAHLPDLNLKQVTELDDRQGTPFVRYEREFQYSQKRSIPDRICFLMRRCSKS